MRKYIYILTALAAICSCEKYLDIKPYGETIPKTPEEFSALLHTHLEDIDTGDRNIVSTIDSNVEVECFSDNFEASLTIYPGGNTLPIYIGNRINNKAYLYEQYYSVIRDCNIIIDNLEERESREARDVLGTAYALRGYCYYMLLCNFCEPCYNNSEGLGVPLVTRFDMEEKPKRSTVAATVKVIEDDYMTAISYDIKDEIYRFNSDVMEALLARLYFWTGDFSKAVTYSQKVLAKYPLISGQEYKDMVTSMYAKKGNMLFRSCIMFTNQLSFNTSINTLKSYRPVSRRFIDLFAEKEADIRYGISFNERREFTKIPVPCIRSAEMQLILAESHYHLGNMTGALEAINELRRNRISPYTDLTMATLPEVYTQDLITKDMKGNEVTPLLSVILCERRKELFCEGDRWYELKRNGRPEFWSARQGRKYTTQEFMYTFPLPITDILLVDGLIQNEGYDKTE